MAEGNAPKPEARPPRAGPMSFLLDTDICSAHLKGAPGVTSRFLQYSGRLHLSVVSLAELYTWALRSQAPPRRSQCLAELLSNLTLLDVDRDVAERFGQVRAELLDRGRPVPGMDLLIGATALVHGLTVVTHNTQDFADIPALTVADWLAE